MTTAQAPAGHRVTVAGTDVTFDVPAGERIHAAARRAGVWLPFECGWGSCGTCKATLVEGEVELLLAGAPAVDARDERRRRILLCQTTPVTDVVVKPVRVQDVPPDERPTLDHGGRLAAVEPLGPSIARFRFDLTVDGHPVTARYRPGQYAVVELGPGLRRCYSLAGLPGESHVELVAKRYAGRVGSNRLFDLQLGDQVALELPYGDMWLREDDAPVVLVAGGTGVSAVLALVRQLVAQDDRRPVHVFYGATTTAELVCWDELVRLTAQLRSGELHGALLTADAGWRGTHGLVTDVLAARLPTVEEPRVYVAGPPPMVGAVRMLLDEHGVQRDRVHLDPFG